MLCNEGRNLKKLMSSYEIKRLYLSFLMTRMFFLFLFLFGCEEVWPRVWNTITVPIHRCCGSSLFSWIRLQLFILIWIRGPNFHFDMDPGSYFTKFKSSDECYRYVTDSLVLLLASYSATVSGRLCKEVHTNGSDSDPLLKGCCWSGSGKMRRIRLRKTSMHGFSV